MQSEDPGGSRLSLDGFLKWTHRYGKYQRELLPDTNRDPAGFLVRDQSEQMSYTYSELDRLGAEVGQRTELRVYRACRTGPLLEEGSGSWIVSDMTNSDCTCSVGAPFISLVPSGGLKGSNSSLSKRQSRRTESRQRPQRFRSPGVVVGSASRKRRHSHSWRTRHHWIRARLRIRLLLQQIRTRLTTAASEWHPGQLHCPWTTILPPFDRSTSFEQVSIR